MKTFRVERPFNPGKLHTDLAAAGVPVLTVRSVHAPEDLADLAMFGVVVTEDNVPENIKELIDSHSENRIPKPWSSSKGKTVEDILKHQEKI